MAQVVHQPQRRILLRRVIREQERMQLQPHQPGHQAALPQVQPQAAVHQTLQGQVLRQPLERQVNNRALTMHRVFV